MAATVSTNVALVPSTLAVADRTQLPPLDRSFVKLVLASLTAALVYRYRL